MFMYNYTVGRHICFGDEGLKKVEFFYLNPLLMGIIFFFEYVNDLYLFLYE